MENERRIIARFVAAMLLCLLALAAFGTALTFIIQPEPKKMEDFE